MIKTLFSKQKWILDRLPTRKMDTDELIRELIFNVFIHHIEERGLLTRFPWDEDEGSREVKKQIDFCYTWIKQKRPLLVDKIDLLNKEFPDVPEDESLWKFVNENHIGEIVELQDSLLAQDKHVLKTIIGFQEYMIEI